MKLVRGYSVNSLPACGTGATRILRRELSSHDFDSRQPPANTTSNTKTKRKNYEPHKVIFSGIQPTGVPHLGNYLGALRQWKEFQDAKTRPKKPKNYKLIYSIVDLHALTHQTQQPWQLLQQRKETLASLLAIGLDPKHCLLYFQSSIPSHSQLMWYLSTVASAGYLSRMTQWKSKLGVGENATIEDHAARERLRLGLFSYPVLQAADILLFKADIVPVGEDQTQHVEFARNLARSFNAQYREAAEGADLFNIPTPYISPARRIMSLKEPTLKMSKSHTDPNSRILITDHPDDVHKKFRTALTDSVGGISYDVENRPGISNLIEILKHVAYPEASCEEIANDHTNQSMRVFKEHVAGETIKLLSGFRERFLHFMEGNDPEIDASLHRCYAIANAVASKNRTQIENVIGLAPVLMHAGSASSKNQENREAIMREQEEENEYDEEEPDVVPQKAEGVDHPIAS